MLRSFLFLSLLLPSCPQVVSAAMQFSGTGASYVHISTGKVGNYFNGGNPVTVGAWVKLESTSTGRILTVYRTGSTVGFYMGFNAGNLECSITACAGGIASVAAPALNEWHHVACRADENSETTRIYVDGVDKGGTFQTCPGSWVQGTPTVGDYIGSADGSTNLFKGQMDDLRIYRNDLGATRIEAWAKSRIRMGTLPNAVAHYPMDEAVDGTGSTAADSVLDRSGNGIHGKPGSATEVLWRNSEIPYP